MESFFGWAGVLGVVLSIYFYVRSLRFKEPYWNFKNVNLIRNSISQIKDLDVLYQGQRIPSISIGKVVFWNRGEETMNGTDIAMADPLRIIGVGDTKILDASVLITNQSANQLRVDIDPSKKFATINFDYLDKNHGGIIQVVHTGTTVRDIKVTGTIKGVSKLKNKRIGVIESKENPFMVFVSRLILLVIGGGAIWFGGLVLFEVMYRIFYTTASSRTPDQTLSLTPTGFLIFGGLGIMALGIFMIYAFLETRRVEPKGLEVYDEDDQRLFGGSEF